jgi:hypothetical protein
VAKWGAFVTEGCLRSYVIDNKGKEHILQFAAENWWLADIHSIANQVPTFYFMDALEPSDVLLLDTAAAHLSFHRLARTAAHACFLLRHLSGNPWPNP